jgi:hypothetical protein
MGKIVSPESVIVMEGTKDGPWHLDLSNPRAIADRVGPKLLAAFMPCFVGADRINSLMNLYLLNAKHGGSDESHSSKRNSWFLQIIAAGTMYELGAALVTLSDMHLGGPGDPIVGKLSSWEGIREIVRRWSKNTRLARAVRNQLSHHLGDLRGYESGLVRLRENPSVAALLRRWSEGRRRNLRRRVDGSCARGGL